MNPTIITPSVPNFVKVQVGKKETVTIPIQDLSEAELRELGRKWTEDLVISARRRTMSRI